MSNWVPYENVPFSYEFAWPYPEIESVVSINYFHIVMKIVLPARLNSLGTKKIE